MAGQGKVNVGDANDLIYGEGKVILNLGEAGEITLGYTNDFNFEEEIEYKEIPYNGSKTATKGMKRITEANAMITGELLEANPDAIELLYSSMRKEEGVDVGGKTFTRLQRDINVNDADYLVNVAIVGFTADGREVKIKVENALGQGALTMAFADKEEVAIPFEFKAHFDPATPNPEKLP